MNESIKLQADVLTTKASYIRSGVKTLMKNWEKISAGAETIYSDTTITAHYDDKFFLQTGSDEIKNYGGHDVDSTRFFSDSLTVPQLRKFVNAFPAMVSEIEKKMEVRNKNSDKILVLLEKLNS